MEKHEHPESEKSDERSYEPPEVQSEQAFESLAITCTKGDQQCPTAPGVTALRS